MPRCLLLAPFVMAQECANPNLVLEGVRILEPHANATRTCKPFRVEVDFNEVGDPQTLQVLVNGVDVSDRFVAGPSYNGRLSASAEWVWEEGLIGIGENTIEARIAFPQGTMHRTRTVAFSGDPYVDDVVSYVPGTQGGFNSGLLPDVVLGRPLGSGLFAGSNDVVSLGLGGNDRARLPGQPRLRRCGAGLHGLRELLSHAGAGPDQRSALLRTGTRKR